MKKPKSNFKMGYRIEETNPAPQEKEIEEISEFFDKRLQSVGVGGKEDLLWIVKQALANARQQEREKIKGELKDEGITSLKRIEAQIPLDTYGLSVREMINREIERLKNL